MAFVSGLPVLSATTASRANGVCTTRMSSGGTNNANMSRRSVLRLAGVFAASGALSAYALDAATKKELREELGTIDYDDELTDVGPDAAAELKTRQKKEVEAPEYVVENAEVVEEADKKFDKMVAEEAAEEAALKAKFSKKK